MTALKRHERVLTAGVIAAGAGLWALALAADSLGLGGSPGYNQRQIVAAEVGVLLIVLAGAYWGRHALSVGNLPRPRRPSAPVAAMAAAALGFIAVSVWWVLADGWVPNGDAGRHLVITSSYLNAVEGGDLLYPLNSPPTIDSEFYPPFVHLVGVLGSLVGGFGVVTGVVTLNLFFVPLLAIGCYGIGSYVFDRWAGVLAVVFVLGTPILISQFHVYMLDAPVTALVAMSVWLLLISKNFSRTGIAALAGVAVGCGILSKATFPIFVVGVVAVLIARGGWRQWQGLLVFFGVALLICQPWLMLHEDLLRSRADRALDMPQDNSPADGKLGLLVLVSILLAVGWAHSTSVVVRQRAAGGWRSWHGVVAVLGGALLVVLLGLMVEQGLGRSSGDPRQVNELADGVLGNYGAYFWGALVVQLLVPLFIFLAIGLGHSVWSVLRRRAPDGVLELLAGLVAGVVAVAMMDWFNTRYDMPLLPYAAVLGVGWIRAFRDVRLRAVAAAALVAVALLNSVMINSGVGGQVTVHMPFSDRYATVFSDSGYIENQPRSDVRVDDLLEDAHAAGARKVIFQPETLNTGGFNLNGLTVFARMADLSTPPSWLVEELGPADIYLTREPLSPDRFACVAVNYETHGVFVYRGGPPGSGEPWCPPGWEHVRGPA